MPTVSLYRWENQVIQLLLDPPQSHAKCQPPSASPNNPLPAPSVGHHLPCGVSIPPQARRVLEKQLPAAVPVCDPPTKGLCWAVARSPQCGSRRQNPLWGQAVFWKGCPQAALLWLPHTHSHSTTLKDPDGHHGAGCFNPHLVRISSTSPHHGPSSPQALLAIGQCEFAGEWVGDAQRSWKKGNTCLTKARRVNRRQEPWAFPSALESTQSRPALASLDDLQLLLLL